MVLERATNNCGFTHEDQSNHNRYLDMLKQEFVRSCSSPPLYEKTPDDYDIIKTLGAGGFASVFLVRDKITFEIYAMKAMEKEDIVKKKNIKHIFLEKKILQCINFPFVCGLESSCKDNVYVYFVMPFEAGGELFTLIRRMGSLGEQLAQFYAAQLVLALEYLHHCSIIHRDLKPENVLICTSGYIKLVDFGFGKIIKNRTWTLCGTPEYIAPEIIMSKGYSYSVDWWALGILIFEMLTGFSPFYCTETVKLYEKILQGHVKYPDGVPPQCKQLIKRLLEVDAAKRYGSLKAGVYDIKSHAWFREVDWTFILHRKVEPPYIPEVKDIGSTENFPPISEKKLKRSPQCLYDEEFENF